MSETSDKVTRISVSITPAANDCIGHIRQKLQESRAEIDSDHSSGIIRLALDLASSDPEGFAKDLTSYALGENAFDPGNSGYASAAFFHSLTTAPTGFEETTEMLSVNLLICCGGLRILAKKGMSIDIREDTQTVEISRRVKKINDTKKAEATRNPVISFHLKSVKSVCLVDLESAKSEEYNVVHARYLPASRAVQLTLSGETEEMK